MALTEKPKVNIIDEKNRVRFLGQKLDGALACGDWELAWNYFQLMGKHMGRLMSVSGVK